MHTYEIVSRNRLFEILHLQDVNIGSYAAYEGWLEAPNAPRLKSYNPATGEVIAEVTLCSEAQYETVMEEAKRAFEEWRLVPAPKRGELVRRIGDVLREHKDALGSLIALEAGKIKAEADGEVQEMIDMADYAVGLSRMLYGITMPSERPGHRLYEQWHPLGPVGVITGFNFPVAVWSWNAFIAAVCGDTVVWKPSPKTPLCTVAVQRLCDRVTAEMGYPGIFSCFLPENPELLDHFVCDRRLPLISFTGSTAVGRQVAVKVAERLGRSLLELSGNNAVIVDETADLDLAVRAILFGAVGTAGQRCTSIRRLIVHESIYDELIDRLVKAYAQVRVGDPLDPSTLMGPLIDQTAVEAYRQAVEEARRQGGEVLYGGRVLERPGCFVEPTLIRAENHWDVVQRETFAPILYVMSYRHLEEAIAMQNDAAHGLSSALFTLNLRAAERFLSASGSDCGIANINAGTSGAEIGGAFGGEKDTGGGREAGSDAWKMYMRRQTNTINWGEGLPLAQGISFFEADPGQKR
ncbi:L-piperidine-6-carboxylate dehydrogenase [Methylocaldum szegediense]|uniref:aldehyde dehydrogenase (NAD(+)) n=1 Tax=Methylocaldum szegediense TaxID=73780 RepID=A0ABN8X4F7_9GAMM|nr:aldehyde dehydrogenase family protein [Methylocaldum szegediense]CAI8870138.1 Aldehyde dehydrogenase (NAD(+)) [Methylocaldum szegediense]